jgi:hypothetical protein
MKTEQLTFTDGAWRETTPGMVLARASLVLAFGDGQLLAGGAAMAHLHERYPGALIIGCSTAGEVCGARLFDRSIVATACQLEHSQVAMAVVGIQSAEESGRAGRELVAKLLRPDLAHVLVLSDGIQVNGTSLVEGLLAELPRGVTISGGLAGDGERMRETFVYAEGSAARGRIVAVGFYGARLRVGCGSLGGWVPFGPERLITRSAGNVLYELDGQSALALYKRYLGEHAAGLPSSGLHFPLSIRPPSGGSSVVRTILGVDEAAQSLTFAGDLPRGHYAQLMRATVDKLVDGAWSAAGLAMQRGTPNPPLTLAISCVGRRLTLKQRTEEELESLREVLPDTTLAGFYSYGELSPAGLSGCELHNQTMTVTTFGEV